MKTIEKKRMVEAMPLSDADDALLEKMKATMMMQFEESTPGRFSTAEAYSLRAASAMAFASILTEQRERFTVRAGQKRTPK